MRGWVGACVVALWSGTGLVGATAQTVRPMIRSEADLPPTRFAMPSLPSETVMTDAGLSQLGPIRAEAERLLANYDIQDPAIAQRLRNGLAAIAILQDRPDDALALIRAQRAAETKPQLRQVGSLVREGLAAGLAGPADRRCTTAAQRVVTTLAAADPLTVRDEVLGAYGTVQVGSPAFHAGSAALVLDSEAKAQGSLGVLKAILLAAMRVEGMVMPTCRSELLDALQAWIDDPAHRPVDIWPNREPGAADLADAAPVVVGVWESGFDPNLFANQIAIDPAEPLDGIDNDGNGVIDDAYGPTFDAMVRPTRDRMVPPSPAFAARFGLQNALEKGLSDLGYGEDTPEARLVAQRSRDASVSEQIADVQVASEWNAASHATWVASLIADPAPFVRLYAVNAFPFGDYPEPVPFVEADVQRWAGVLPGVAARMRSAGVRIVNMSWTSDADGIADELLRSGAESDPEQAKARGAAMAATMRDAIDAAIRDCPDILFVAGAGNSDQSEEIQDAAPQTLDRANILVVGAAGMAGNATAFTTYGSRVRIYALGEGNILRSPGGQVLRRSGTSFAGPIVARAAAAMLAVAPALSPTQLIEGLTSTAHPEPGGDLPLLDAGAAVRWAGAL